MEASLAARTLERARSAMQSAKIASLPEVVKLLRALSGNSQQVSVVELAEVIQSDPTIVAKVIGAANTLAYNPNGVKVASVHQAIHVIGYERIRTLAMSLMLAEQVSRSHSPEEQREYAAQSLLAGCLAQAIAAGRATLDKEQAFICASLRNFGQIVLTSCMGEEFRELRKAAGGEPDDAGYRRVFGLTPLELGRQLLDAANLPEEILTTIRALPPEAFAELDTKPDDQLLALTAFAGELAALTGDPRSDPSEFAAKSRALALRYEHVLPLLHEEVHHVMDSATAQLDQLVRVFRLKSLPQRMMMRMVKCRNAVDPNRPVSDQVPVPAATAGRAAPPEPRAAADQPPAASPEQPAKPASPPVAKAVGAPAPATSPAVLPNHDWVGSLKQFTEMLRNPGLSRDQVFGQLLETVRTGLGAGDCLLFTAESGRTAFPLVQGQGRLYEDLGRFPLEVVAGERTVLGVCLARKENIMIHHAREAKIMPYLPPWLKDQTEMGAFVLLPLSDGNEVGGVLLVGWSEARQIVLPPECVRSVRSMLALVCRIGRRLAA